MTTLEQLPGGQEGAAGRSPAQRRASVLAVKHVAQQRLITLALFLVGVLITAIWAPLQLDPLDDGLYLYQANRLLHGGLPYRDFAMHDAPLYNLWHALLLMVFGNDVLVLRLALVPFEAAMLPLIYLLVRALLPTIPALLTSLLAPLMLVGLAARYHYSAPHVAINATTCALLTLVTLLRWRAHRRAGWLLLAGIIIGIEAGFKQNMGLYLLAGVGLWLLEPGWDTDSPAGAGRSAYTPRRANLGYALRLGAWVAVVGAILWLIRPHLQWIVVATILVPPLVLLGQVGGQRPALTCFVDPVRALGRLAWLGGGFALATLPWIIGYSLLLGPATLLRGLVEEPSRLASIWFHSLSIPSLQFWAFVGMLGGWGLILATGMRLAQTRRLPRLVPFLLAGAAAFSVLLVAVVKPQVGEDGIFYLGVYSFIWVFWGAWWLSRQIAPDTQQPVRLLLLVAVLAALEIYPQMLPIYATWVFPIWLPLAGWVLWEGSARLGARLQPEVGSYWYKAARLLPVSLVLLGGCEMLRWSLVQYVDVGRSLQTRRLALVPLVNLDLPHAHLLGLPAQREAEQQILTAVTAYSDAAMPIYCFSRQLIFYSVADRQAAVWNVHIPPTLDAAAMGEDEFQMRDSLQRSQVPVVVVDGPVPAEGHLRAGDWPAWGAPIVDYLNANFRPIYSSDIASVWVRTSMAPAR